MDYLWRIFWELKTGERITFTEIDAYSRLTQTDFEPWEVEILQTLDRMCWKIAYA